MGWRGAVRRIRDKATPFDEQPTAQRTPVISLSSVYPISTLRNRTSGTVTRSGAEYEVAAGGRLETAEIGRYVSGYAAEAGIGLRVPSLASGQVVRWGYFDDDNGYFFRYDADGLHAVRRDGGVDDAALIATDIDPADGWVWHIQFVYYGYGPIEWRVADSEQDPQTVVQLHRSRVKGQSSTLTPNLPLRVENDTAGSVFVGGRQFSIVGRYLPTQRITAAKHTGKTVSDSFVPVCSFRRKDTSDAANVSLLVEGLSVLTSVDVEIEVLVGASLTGASWATPENRSADETGIEVDSSASGFTGGESIWQQMIAADSQGDRHVGGAAFLRPDRREREGDAAGGRGVVARATAGRSMVSAVGHQGQPRR